MSTLRFARSDFLFAPLRGAGPREAARVISWLHDVA
jgi:hypothetical protein